MPRCGFEFYKNDKLIIDNHKEYSQISNMFNYNLRAKSINKSIDITRNKNNNIIKKDEDIQNEKSQLIKVNHMKKAKINKNKINFVLNKSMNKNN